MTPTHPDYPPLHAGEPDLTENTYRHYAGVDAEEADASGWRPIETAPKDGTVIDIWMVDDAGNGWRVPDAWFVHKSVCDVPELVDGEYVWGRKYGKRSGWFEKNRRDMRMSYWCDEATGEQWLRGWRYNKATHWMPLPAPPRAAIEAMRAKP